MSGLILYFQNSNGDRRKIGNPNSIDEVSNIISDFLKNHNYKSYYTRTWKNENGEICYDVGSHSEFFILVDDKKYDEIRKAIK